MRAEPALDTIERKLSELWGKVQELETQVAVFGVPLEFATAPQCRWMSEEVLAKAGLPSSATVDMHGLFDKYQGRERELFYGICRRCGVDARQVAAVLLPQCAGMSELDEDLDTAIGKIAPQSFQLLLPNRNSERFKPVLSWGSSPKPDVHAVTNGTSARTVNNVTTTNTEAILDSDSYRFQPTVWDTAFFIGLPEVGSFGSLYQLGVLACNVIVQLCFTWIVWNNMTESEFDGKLDGYREWRLRVGHKLTYYDEVGGKTLAARVCHGDPANELSYGQQNALERINEYLPSSTTSEGRGLLGESVGPAMCMIAVVVWSLAITCELQQIFHQIYAIWFMPRTTQTRFERCSESIGVRKKLLSFARRRFIGISCLLVVRTGIAFWLLVAGAFFLVHTIDLREILLNAVGLGFVLNIDEMFFELLPLRTRNLVVEVAPLPVPRRRGSVRGLDWEGPLMLTFILIAVSLFCVLRLVPEVQLLKDVRDVMCGGSLQPVYGVTAYPPYIFWHSPTGFGTEFAEVPWAEWQQPPSGGESWYFPDEVMAEILPDPSNSNLERVYSALELPTLRGGTWSLMEVQAWNQQEVATKYNRLCDDLLPYPEDSNRYGRKHTWTFPRALGLSVNASCHDMVQWCFDDSTPGYFARLFCPESCLCKRLGTTQVMLDGRSGCSDHCAESDEFALSLENAVCEDDVNGDVMEMAFGLNYSSRFWGLNGEMQRLLPLLTQGEGGCAAFAEALKDPSTVLALDVCSDDTERLVPLVPFRYRCPVTCGCTKTMAYCPRTCPV